jgi:putative restriction endonuclease
MDSKYGKKWSDDETILAFYYYCQIPFGKIHKSNPDIIRLASILGRTPSSVSLKMGNLGHFDPELQKRNVNGLSNASRTDEKIVLKFSDNWEELTSEAKRIEAFLTNQASVEDMANEPAPEGGTRETIVNARINQQFFRAAVLASYQQTCCMTGISIPTLLVASHIKPWAVSNPRTERTNPRNGLCLNALHDKAFDKGLITVLPDYTIRVSSQLQNTNGPDQDSIAWLMQCNHSKIRLPEKFFPKKEYLEYHNDVIFIP